MFKAKELEGREWINLAQKTGDWRPLNDMTVYLNFP
jgi:hypothetical protein